MENRPGWRLSLVLPAFNEEPGIRQAVLEADEALVLLCADREILVVDDGSTDGTARVVEEMTRELPHVRLIRHVTNRGYGPALRTGFQAARMDRIAFTDADCQFHLADLEPLLRLTDTNPVAVGYRIDRKDPWRRRFLSRGYNLLARTLLGTRVRDIDCALKVFRREALVQLLPETPGFFVNTEMLTRARQLHLAVAEVGVRHRPRCDGQSKISLRDVPRSLATLLPFWWSRVLFAGENRTSVTPSRVPLGGFLALVFMACLLFFARLDVPLLEPQESRYAEIPRQMLAEGNFLIPSLHGEPYLDKPPLLYWLTMASYLTFGVHDWAARLVPSLVGVLTILTTFWWGTRIFGSRAGFLAAALLCLMPSFIYLGRMLVFDGLLGLCVVASLAMAHVAIVSPRLHLGWWLGSALACALGLLTKGPVALVLVTAPIAAYQLIDPRGNRLSSRNIASWLAAACGLAAPWYVAVAATQPGYLTDFFWTHNVVRFLAPFDHQKPLWFFLPGLLMGLMPWTLLLPGFVLFLARHSRRTGQRRPPALGFVLLAFMGGFAFFSLSGCKRPVYLVPVIPPLALALGFYLDQLIARPTWAALWQRGVPLARIATIASILVGCLVTLAASVSGLIAPSVAISTVAVGMTFLGFIAWTTQGVSWGATGLVTLAILVLGIRGLLPAYNQRFGLREDLRTMALLNRDGQVPVFCFPQRWDSVSFYLPNAEVHVYGRKQLPELLRDLHDHPEAILLVKSGPYLRQVLRELPASLQFAADANSGAVTVGWVRLRNGWQVADSGR